MDYLYFIILIVAVFAITLFFYKKNKKNSNVYIINDDVDAENKAESKEDSSVKDDFKISKSDDYKFEITYYWITQKVNPQNNIDYDILKNIMLQNFQKLPEVLEDPTTFVNEDAEELLKEVMGHVDYSSPVKFFVINKGRKLLDFLRYILLIAGLICFFLFQIEIRKDTDDYSFFYFILAVTAFLLSFIFSKLSKKFFSIIIKTLKPGDFIKILSAPDEVIEQKVKINQLSPNETIFNKTTIALSKKKIICEEFIQQSSDNLNTINNKICLYIAIDYLKLYFSKEAYREYLLEKEIPVLEFICGFNPKSVSANFELALQYLESKRFDDFYESLLHCRNINGYDWIVESYIRAYEFCSEFSEIQ